MKHISTTFTVYTANKIFTLLKALVNSTAAEFLQNLMRHKQKKSSYSAQRHYTHGRELLVNLEHFSDFIKVASCDHQADSPFQLWPDVRFGDLQTEKIVQSYMTLNIL